MTGPRAGDAHALLGGAAMQLEDRAGAAFHLGLALALHTLAGAWAAQARDAHQLAGLRIQAGAHEAAMAALDVAYQGAVRAEDPRMMLYAEVARADLMRAVGAFQAAEAAIGRAQKLARDPGDLAIARLKQGVLYIDRGNWRLARSPLERVVRDERAGQRRAYVLTSAYLNLAYVERKAGAFAEAKRYLALARTLAPDDELAYQLNTGLVLRDAGELAAAETALAAAEATGPSSKWAWWVAYNRGVVAAARGDDTTAIAHHQTAIARVEALAGQAGAWGASLVASLRQPHVALIGLHARRGAWREVLDVVVAMDGQALLESRVAMVDRTFEVAPRTQPRAARETWTADAILAAWRGRRLVIVVPGGEVLWRLELEGGEVRGEAIGAEPTLAELARAVEIDPANTTAAAALRTALHVDGHGVRTDLLLIGPVARAPLAVLGAPGTLVRVLGIVPRRAPRRDGAALRIAIGDPNGDLAAAKTEAEHVAERLGARSLIGAAATRAAFAEVRGAELVHLAAHTALRLEGAVLRLADSDLAAREIAELRPAPRLVVLASCAGATGLDDAGTGSIAAAFLEAGADAVVAARWSVGDADALALMTAFYERGGAVEPAGALGAAQRALAETQPVAAWAAFEVIAARPIAR